MAIHINVAPFRLRMPGASSPRDHTGDLRAKPLMRRPLSAHRCREPQWQGDSICL